MPARIIDITHPDHSNILTDVLASGGVVASLWGHHLYYLACNAFDGSAVQKLNAIKGRPADQILAMPGLSEEALEFTDARTNQVLKHTAKKAGMSPEQYIHFLYASFPIAMEFRANEKAPTSTTFVAGTQKTIWIIGHARDRRYAHLIETVRSLRNNGKSIVLAGTSLNLTGGKTLTVKNEKVAIDTFGDKVDILSVHPNARSLKKLRFTASSTVISFTHDRPLVLRLGVTPLKTLAKYIPGIKLSPDHKSTR